MQEIIKLSFEGWHLLIMFAIPFASITLIYWIAVAANKKTTGEIKYIIPPDMLLKILAVFVIVFVIFVLGLSKIIGDSTVSALLGAIASGAIGMAFKKECSQEELLKKLVREKNKS